MAVSEGEEPQTLRAHGIAAGRTIRVLSLVVAITPEGPALEVNTGFASQRVTRVLDETSGARRPQAIRCDNGLG